MLLEAEVFLRCWIIYAVRPCHGTLRACRGSLAVGGGLLRAFFARRLLPLCMTLLLADAVAAEQFREIDFDVSRQNVEAALSELATQADALLLFPYDLIEPVDSHPVNGRHTVQEALDILLQDTGLTGGLTDGGVITISRAAGTDGQRGTEMKQNENKAAAKNRGLIGVLAAVFSAGAAAQEPADGGANAGALEEVIVTGSRISRTDLSSSSPVTVIGNEEIDARGVLRVEDLINILPQALAGQSAFSGIGAGTATVNLRGLGAERTLVLVDGKRLPFGSPISVAADLNQIPAQLVERVEVLTGGASAVYGADAIAGVVNFRMKRDFEGLDVNLQGGFFQTGNSVGGVERVLADFGQPDPGSATDGGSVDLNIIMGGNLDGGKGNITGYFGYSNDNEVKWEDRDISSCPFGTRNNGTELSCQGSGSMPSSTRFTRAGLDGFNLTVDPDTLQLRDFDTATDTFNFSGGNFFQRPRERFTMGASMHYELHPKAEWFLNYSFVDNATTASIAPSGLSLGRTNSINCDNPLLSDEQLAVICDPAFTFVDTDGVERAPVFIGRRNLEGGPRTNEFKLATHRVVTGFRGEAFEGFNYEVFGQFANVDFAETLENDVLTPKATLALDVVTDPGTGQPVCRSALSGQEPDCVPWNILQPGGVTQAATEFITAPSLRNGLTEQLVLGASLSGDLTDYGVVSPFADTGIQVVGGYEFRRDELALTPAPGDGLTLVREPVSGEIAVYEFFTEVQVPLVEAKPLLEELVLHGAYRYSDYYDTTGTQSTYSGGLTWQPSSDLRIRGQFQRATRSPNPIELFSPQADGAVILSAGVNGLRDPCAGDFDPATSTPEPANSLDECARSGVTAAQYGQILDSTTGEFNTLAGGNPDLDPETSDTFTAGIVFTPQFIPGLSLSVDYFSIDVEDFVGTVPPELALDSCVNDNEAFFCNLINRDSAGTLWLIEGEGFIQATNINTGRLSTTGVDINTDYVFDLADIGLPFGGSVRLQYIATLLDEFEEESLPGETPFDCAGFYGGVCGTPRPEYRHIASVEWMSGEKLSATFAWRSVGSVKQFSTNPSPVIAKLDSTSFFDLSARYTLSDRYEFRLGINNLFDETPPLTSIAGFGGTETSGRGNTFPQIYDAQGRFVFGGIRGSF